jgi:hypothetical protein
LSAKTAQDYTSEVTAANQLGFVAAQSELATSAPNLDRLRDQLDRDYAVLNRLIKTSSGDSFI